MTDALLQNEKRLYDVMDLMTHSSNQAAEDIARLKRQMTPCTFIKKVKYMLTYSS